MENSMLFNFILGIIENPDKSDKEKAEVIFQTFQQLISRYASLADNFYNSFNVYTYDEALEHFKINPKQKEANEENWRKE